MPTSKFLAEPEVEEATVYSALRSRGVRGAISAVLLCDDGNARRRTFICAWPMRWRPRPRRSWCGWNPGSRGKF